MSLLESLAATDAYVAASGASVASEFIGCGPAFALALTADMAATVIFGLVENGSAFFSLLFTALSDGLQGSMGIDPDIGLYTGKDTVVAGRNFLAGLIPESYIDLGVSISQVKYDVDRAGGNKPGGYIPVFDISTNWQMPPIHKDFQKQFFFQDWWYWCF